MTSDTTVSTHPKTSDRLAHSRSFLLSDVSATSRAAAAGTVPLADPPINAYASVSYDPAASD
jgi:hypothetical protein